MGGNKIKSKLFSIPPINSIPLEFFFTAANAILLVSAPAIVSPDIVNNFQFTIILYMVLLISFSRYAEEPMFTERPPEWAFAWFGIGLVATSVFFYTFDQIPNLLNTFAIAKNEMVVLAYQAFTVSGSEEIIFRGYLPRVIGVIPSQIFFGILHWATYQGALILIVTAIAAGLIFWGIDRITQSLYTSVGVHTVYNLKVKGVLMIILPAAGIVLGAVFLFIMLFALSCLLAYIKYRTDLSLKEVYINGKY